MTSTYCNTYNFLSLSPQCSALSYECVYVCRGRTIYVYTVYANVRLNMHATKTAPHQWEICVRVYLFHA